MFTLTPNTILKIVGVILIAGFFAISVNAVQADPIDYDFTFTATFGPQPSGSFTYDDTPGAGSFTAFSVDVLPQGLNDRFVALSPSLASFLFGVLDGPPAAFSPFVVATYPFGKTLWFVDGTYQFFLPNDRVLTHEGTYTISRATAVAVVGIDIHPGSDPNSINLCSNGAVPVAILGSDTFNVDDIDPSSLRFADATVKVVGKKDPLSLCSYEDVNFDGFADVVCHFVTTDIAALDGDSTTATVNGALFDGTLIEGSDSVNIVKDTCY